MGRSNL